MYMPSKSYSDSNLKFLPAACYGFSSLLKTLSVVGFTGAGAVAVALVVVLVLWFCLKG